MIIVLQMVNLQEDTPLPRFVERVAFTTRGFFTEAAIIYYFRRSPYCHWQLV